MFINIQFLKTLSFIFPLMVRGEMLPAYITNTRFNNAVTDKSPTPKSLPPSAVVCYMTDRHMNTIQDNKVW